MKFLSFLITLTIGVSSFATQAAVHTYKCGGFGGGEVVTGLVKVSPNTMKTTFSNTTGTRISSSNLNWIKFGPFLSGENVAYSVLASSGMLIGQSKGGLVFLFPNKTDNAKFGCTLVK